MNFVDISILGIVAIAFILGFKDGFVRKLIGLLGLIIAIFLAVEFSKQGGELLSPVFSNEAYLAEIVAGILIFLIVMVIVAIIKRLIHPIDKVNRLLNQILGGFSGIIQVLFFISAFLLFLNIFQFPAEKDKKASFLYKPIASILPGAIDLIMGVNSETKQFIYKKFINSKDSTITPADSLKLEN